MTLLEQLAALAKAKAAKEDQISTLMGGSIEKGETPDGDTADQIKALRAEVSTIDDNMGIVQDLIKSQEDRAAQTKSATTVAGNSAADALKAAGHGSRVEVKAVDLPKGHGFAKLVRIKTAAAKRRAKGEDVSNVDVAKELGESDHIVAMVTKASAASTTDPNYAPLVDDSVYVSEFLELLREKTIVDKIIGGMRQVPFNTKVLKHSAVAVAGWTGEGQAKPVTNSAFDTVSMSEHKVAAIAVTTDELMRNSNFATDQMLLDDLLEAVQKTMDQTFVGAAAADANKPVGLLNGVTAVASTGVTAAAYEADVATIVDALLSGNHSLLGAKLIMGTVRMQQMSRLRDALGGKYFPGLQETLRTLDTIEVIDSEEVTDKIIVVQPRGLLVAQDDRVDVSFSTEATIDLGGSSGTVNLFQNNMSAIRVERYISWAKGYSDVAGYVQYT